MKTGTSGRKSLGTPVAAVSVALLILVTVFAYALLSTEQTTSTSAPTTSNASATAETAIHVSSPSSVSMSVASSANSTALPVGCSPLQGGTYLPGATYNLTVGSASPATVCVQFYWFDSSANVTLTTTSLLIPPPCESAAVCQSEQKGVNRSLAGNFTLAASEGPLVLGGPTNANEGTVVAFTLTAKPGVVGTYTLTLQHFMLALQSGALSPDVQTAYLAPAQGYSLCFPYFDLVVGNGQPNFAAGPNPTTGCYSGGGAVGAPPVAFGVPGLSYMVPPNVAFFRVVSTTNSTQ